MGTRSLTIVKSRWDAEQEYATNATIYRHFDGYPEAQGRLVAEFLDGLHLVNGIGCDMPDRYANGPGRLAAQLVCFMPEHTDPDLQPAGAVSGQEYEYHILCQYQPVSIEVVVFDGPMTFFGAGGEDCTNEVFRGSVDEYKAWLDKVTAKA